VLEERLEEAKEAKNWNICFFGSLFPYSLFFYHWLHYVSFILNLTFFFFFFFNSGLCARKADILPFEPHLQSIFLWLIWRWVLQTIYSGLPRTTILPISASQVARITGVSHWCLVFSPSSQIFSVTSFFLHPPLTLLFLICIYWMKFYNFWS
jgi:hypothetical protein